MRVFTFRLTSFSRQLKLRTEGRCWSAPRLPLGQGSKYLFGTLLVVAPPKYDIHKIKFVTGGPVWERAVDLYERGKVTQFKDNEGFFSAVVTGGNPYEVWVSAERFDVGGCTCYLGQKDELCKHMVALAIWTVAHGRPLEEEDKVMRSVPQCSGRRGVLTENELVLAKAEISAGMRCIKAYHGPSRTWFAYQASLFEGCDRVASVFSELPVSEQTTQLVVKTLLRLDKKLCRGGVDDSDGTIGGFIEESVVMLERYAQIDSLCAQAFLPLIGYETCFEWEEPLLKFIKK